MKYLNEIVCVDVFDIIKELDKDSVDLIVTSPPYWMLRNYFVDGELGHEKTYQEYVDKLVTLFELCREPLKKKGSIFIVMGDTYSSNRLGNQHPTSYERKKRGISWDTESIKHPSKLEVECDIPNRCEIGIPWRFAIRMIDNGWYLLNDIIWSKEYIELKENRISGCAMPFTGKRRFSHFSKEYIFFFSKTGEPYFDYDEISIQNKSGTGRRAIPSVWRCNPEGRPIKHTAQYPEKLIELPIRACCPIGGVVLDPFLGSGTTAVVAKRLGRNYIGIDMGEEYCKIAKERIDDKTSSEGKPEALEQVDRRSEEEMEQVV